LPATDVIAFMRATLPPPPARVLEVGAGDGELAAALAAAGYEVVAIDPASEVENVRRVALHELDEAPFDAALAVVSLHHVEPFAEFDFERLDERAARWWLERSGHGGEPADVLGVVDHMHSLRRLCDGLAPWFEIGEPVRGAYLYRWNIPTDVRADEEAGIAAGELPAMGARLVGIRRP
jgi:SAM-dependent methyltransferase